MPNLCCSQSQYPAIGQSSALLGYIFPVHNKITNLMALVFFNYIPKPHEDTGLSEN